MTEAATGTGSVDTTTSVAPPTTSTGDWFESLTPDLKVEKSIQSFKGKPITDVVKSYVEAQKMVGGSIRLPKPDAKPEDREAFMADLSSKLGRPATAAEYKQALKLEALPEGTPWEEGAFDEFLAEMHKAHATPAQVNAAANSYRRILAKGMEQNEARRAEHEALLRKEWGNDFERKEVLATRAALEIGGEEYLRLLTEKGINHHPLVLRAHAAYGETLAESKIITGDIPGQPGPNEASEKIKAMFADKNHPFHKGDKEAVAEYLRLTEIEQGAAGRRPMATFG